MRISERAKETLVIASVLAAILLWIVGWTVYWGPIAGPLMAFILLILGSSLCCLFSGAWRMNPDKEW